MKQITSLWLLLFFMASTTLIAQNTSTGSAAQKAATAKYKTEQQNLNAKVQPEMISGVKQGSEADKSPMEARRITNSTDEQWDVLYTFSAQAPSSQAIATDGENFYLTYWNGTGLFDKFDMDGSYISSFTISGAAAIRDLAYDGTYFYGAPSGGMTIAKLDLANQTLVSTFAISSSAGVTGSRHLSYDPELSASGGFWLGQWGELAAVDMTGATIYSNSQTPAIVSCYSSAYDNYSSPGSPKLWLFTQNAGASANDLIMLQEFDINTRTLTGFTMDLFTLSGNMPGYIPGTAAAQTIAGGAASYVNASGKFVLAVNIQQSPNLVVGLELAETGPPLTKDVGVTSIPQPVSGYDLGNAETVSFNLKNIGTNSQSNIPWTVTWNGPSGTQNLNGTAAGPLASGETLLVTAGTANLSQFGEYSFEICSNLAGDENPDNNCKTKSVVNSPAPTLLYPQSAERWTGSTNGTAITETSLVKGANAEDGWFVFDVSSIPVGATITSVKFHGYVYQTNYPYWSLTPLSLNPLTADPAALKAEITANGVTGIAYSYNNETSTFAIGWHEYQLTAAAATDMTADLAQGWFAMGMDSRDNSATYFINFEGWNETNVPYLEVEFTGGTTTVGTPPANFMADFVEGEGVITTWGSAGEWVRWDSGENAGSLGLEEAGTFWCAARWETADLAPYAGQYITEVNYFPVLYADAPGIKLMIWEGAGFADLVYEQVLTNINWDEFNTVTLSEMHMIDATKEMMVGFELIQPLGEYPMGYDAGPAVAGKGDLVSLDGITFVSMATEFEIDNNFNIGVYVMAETDGLVGTKQILARNTVSNPSGAFTTQTAKVGGNLNNGTRLEKLGVNIYRNGAKVNGEPVQGNTYTDPFFTPGTYTYTAKTVYDEGLSEPTPPEEVVIPQANEPAISVAPSSLMETHPVNDTITTKTVTIQNVGTEPLVWSMVANTGNTKSSVVSSSDPIEDQRILEERLAAEGNSTSRHSLGMAPAGSSQPVETPVNLTGGIRGEIAYGNNVEANNFFSIDVDNPSAPTVIGATSYTAFCGDFAPGDVDNMYVIDYDTDVLKMVDIATGVATDVVSVPCPMAGSGGIWTDLAIDKNDGTFYATATDINFSNLYIIDPASGVITLVGDIGVAAIISCTIDLDGVMYGFDIVSDNTYSIDVATGAATLLGPAGFDGNYAQGMGYDAVNDVVYLAAYAASAQLRTLNTSTGATTLIGALPGETGAFGFPYEGGTPATNDLSISSIVSPNTGVNLTNAEAVVIKIKNNGSAAQSNFPWAVTWNGPTGAGSANGTYTGSLAAGASVEVAAGTADLSIHGDYPFEACVTLAGDENPANNCKSKTVSNNLPEYCPASTTTEDEFIQNVLCGAINNTSGWQGGVANYTDMYAEINAGESEAIVVTNGNAWTSDKVTCWVDWNMSYTFDEGDEKFVLTSDGTGLTFTGAIAVPAGTPNGDYRMRVRMSYSVDPVPCGVMSYGEVEDYTIKVGGGTTTAWLSVPDNTGGTLAPGASQPVTVTFNSNGLPDGTYEGSLDITSNDPNNPLVVVPATLVVGGSVQGLVVAPDMLDETHSAPDQQTEQNLTFTNNGSAPVDVTLSIDLGTTLAPAFTITPEAYAKKLAERQAAEGTGTSKHSLGMAPAGSSQPVETPVNLTGGIRGEIAYGNNVEANNFFSIDVDNPSAPTVIGATSYTAFCGDFEPGDVDNMYVIDYDTDVLKMVDIATGVATDVVSVPCPMAGSGGIWTDLAIDKNDGTFYATATDINFSNLYIIDPSSGVITLVGDIGVAAIISCTIDLDGVMYGFDIVSDNTYSIDVATGAATLLGPAGFDGNYAQGMGYDAVNDVVYLAAYAASAQLRTLNTSTGATTLIGALPGETGAFGFPYEGGTPATNDLSISSIVSPNTGVNLTNAEAVVIKIKNNGSAAQSNFPWTVTWNGPTGAGSANGTYTGSLAAGASVEVTAGTANLSTYGLYTFEACVNLAGDENPANNCKTKNVSNDEPSLCVDNLYSSGCSFGDGLIAWNLANIDVPNIPCSGTPPWYHDYRDMIHELPAGETYTLTIQAGYANTYVDVWIDYNDDLLLTDNELVINDAVCTDGNVPYTFQITIPETAPGGDHVLRFRTNWTAPVTDPCATYSYGNCCDFKANTGEGGPTTDWLWIDEADLTFTLPANGGTKVVPVHFDSEGLAYGDYMGAINVSSNDPINPMIEVPATLHVLPGTGELVVNPTSLTETHYVPPAQTTTQVLELTNNTGGPVAWTLAIDAGVDAGFLNIVPEVSAETPVYTGQMEVEREPGITPGEMVEGPANYASFFGTRGELYNNGGFVTAEGVGTNGTDYSELQDASLTMGTYGSGCQISAGNSIADDFVVPANWSVESFTFFAYQTGSGTTSTLNAVHVQIYDGDPSAGGTVIYGDMTTNVMESTSWTNAWRVLESAPSENRPIMQIVASTPDLSLAPGTYWVEMSIGGTGASGPWAPPITVVGQTTTGNSIQKTTTGWAPLIDVGPQGLPFIITGTGEVAPWLTASPVSGTINNGQTIPINVTFNSEGLDPDTYTGSITISSNQPDLVVPVTFIVEVESPYLPPQNLTAEVQDWYNVFLEWDPPASGSFDPEWITYSSDVITNSIGTNAAANFDVAARFTPDMLGDFEGGMLTKIDFVPGEPSSLSTYTLKVWQGGNNNPTLVYSQPVTTIVADQWNTVTLTTPVEIDVNQELWFGFNCNATGGFPAGCDDGPQVEGFGNMMFWNGAWTTLSQLGATLTFDWAVKGYVEAGGMQVESYNIYRETLDPTEYDLVGNTDELFYLDEELGVDCFKYYVTAVYGPDMESGPSNIVEEICTSISDPSGASSSLQIYPNPAKDQFTIKSETELQSVIMVNYSGQVVMNRKATGNELLINANDFAKGVYTLQVETKDGRSVHKVVIQ